MRAWAGSLAVALCLGVTACGTHTSDPSASANSCAGAEKTPRNLASVDPTAARYFPRIAASCLLVDGRRLSNANVAVAISGEYTTEVRTASSMSGQVAPAPLTSPAWSRWGAVHAVLGALVTQATEADHIQVSDHLVQAGVADCKQAAKMTHMPSTCSAAAFRDAYAAKAEEERIKARGQTMQQWLAAQLPKHTIYISGYDVTASELTSVALAPPGCNQSMGC